VGRSYLYDLTPEGYTPIDLAWAKEDRWEPGHQGQVYETVGKMEDRFYVEYLEDWKWVEFLLALSPLVEPGAASPVDHACPDDAIVDVNSEHCVTVEECVVHEGDYDLYTWTVTNDCFSVTACGLCGFAIPHSSQWTGVSHSEPAAWIFSETPSYWQWLFPGTGCLGIGETAEFAVRVPAPTTDAMGMATLQGCQPAWPPILIHTTAPIPEECECCDLTVQITDIECVCPHGSGRDCEINVTAAICNPGDCPCDIKTLFLRAETSPDVGTYSVPLSISYPLAPYCYSYYGVSFTIPVSGTPPALVAVTVEVDPYDYITECDEDNNRHTLQVGCPVFK
jgi:hypothetical protein